MHHQSEEVAMNKPQRTDRQTGQAFKVFPFHELHRFKIALCRFFGVEME